MGTVSGDPYAVWYRRAIDAGVAAIRDYSRPPNAGVGRADPGGLADADAAGNVQAVADGHADGGVQGGASDTERALRRAATGADRASGNFDPPMP